MYHVPPKRSIELSYSYTIYLIDAQMTTASVVIRQIPFKVQKTSKRTLCSCARGHKGNSSHAMAAVCHARFHPSSASAQPPVSLPSGVPCISNFPCVILGSWECKVAIGSVQLCAEGLEGEGMVGEKWKGRVVTEGVDRDH